MARISFKLPSQIDDAECRGWLQQAIAKGKPGPEFQAIRAHAPGVMRSSDARPPTERRKPPCGGLR